jgi:hypothetical protein
MKRTLTNRAGAKGPPPTVKKEDIEMEKKKYPFYMYHPEIQDPLRVDNKDEERQLAEKGWVSHYIKHKYPTWLDGKIFKTKEEHEAYLASKPKVTVGELPEEQQEADERPAGRRRRG